MKSKAVIILTLLLSVVMMLSLASCTKSEKEISDNTDNTKLPIQSETPDVCPVCKCELDNHTPKISISYIFEDGVLNICGNGSMEQLYIEGKAPWAEYTDEIITVNIYFGVKSIGANAFSGCENLKTVYMENGIESIGNNAFFGCKKLEGIKLPDSLKIIGSYAFNSCESITEIYIPEGVTDIGEGAFALCTGLAKVNIPSAVVIIGELVFAGCSPDIVLTVSENNKYYTYDGKALITKDGTLLIFVHPSLPEYTVPETVTSIGKCAFYNCLLIENIKLPKSIKLIGSGVFDGCIKLKDIHYDGTAYDWTEVVGMEAVATAYAYIKINVIPVCGFCGSSEHTTHPTCPECGSYDHIEHPKLIMGHLSDEELLNQAKMLIEKYDTFTRFISYGTHRGNQYYVLYKSNTNNIKNRWEYDFSKVDELTDTPLYENMDYEDFNKIASIEQETGVIQYGVVKAGTKTMMNPNGKDISSQDWYYPLAAPGYHTLNLVTNYQNYAEYRNELSKYFSNSISDEIFNTAKSSIIEINGRLFQQDIGFFGGRGGDESLIEIDSAQLIYRDNNKCIVQVYNTDFGERYSLMKFTFTMENSKFVISSYDYQSLIGN